MPVNLGKKPGRGSNQSQCDWAKVSKEKGGAREKRLPVIKQEEHEKILRRLGGGQNL